MWTMSEIPKSPAEFSPNHFVFLAERTTPVSTVHLNVDTSVEIETPDDAIPCQPASNEHIVSDDGYYVIVDAADRDDPDDEPPSKQSRVEVGDYNSDGDRHYSEKGFCADDANAMNDDDDDMPMQREQLSLDIIHGDSSEGGESCYEAGYDRSKSSRAGKFCSEEVYKILRSTKNADVLRDVPRGQKDNCQFVIDNTSNVTRKSSHQPNRFWGDCGV